MMKEDTTMQLKKMVFYIMIFGILFLNFGLQTQAASKNSKLYNRFLKKSSVNAGVEKVSPKYFRTLDINKDGVKELMIQNEEYSWEYYIFTIRNEKVTYVGKINSKYSMGYVVYNPKTKSLVSREGGTGARTLIMYKLAKGKLKEGISVEFNYITPKKVIYLHNGKKCSKKKYDKLFNKYFKESNIKEYKFLKNNNTNRKKFLK